MGERRAGLEGRWMSQSLVLSSNLTIYHVSPSHPEPRVLTFGCSFYLMVVQFILDVTVQCTSWPIRLTSRLVQQHLLAAVLCNNRRWGGPGRVLIRAPLVCRPRQSVNIVSALVCPSYTLPSSSLLVSLFCLSPTLSFYFHLLLLLLLLASP